MANNRWLIMPVEVKHREFHARMILSALAAERGLRVLVGKDTMIRRLAPALPRAVIFDKSLGTARHGKPQRFEKLGHKVTVLDEESTGYYGSPEQFLSVRLAKETLDACARWYCISDKLREHVSKLYPEHRDRFEVPGLIRTDSWRKPFHGFYEAERKRIADAHGPFILFNSNFGGIIHARGQAFVDKQIRGQKQAYSDVQNRMAKIFDEGKPNLEAFIALMPKLCEWFPSHRIVVRPHPSETLSFWQETFAGNQQITVSNEGVATPWILASDMLVHHGCTTGIEAAILGKQHVMFAPHPDEHHDTDVMASFGPIIKDTKTLQVHIKKHLAKPGTPKATARMERYFANLNGKLVAETIADDLEQLTFESDDLPKTLPFHVSARIWLANIKLRSDREQTYIKQKWPGTSVEEINQCLKIAGAGLGLNTNFSVKEVFSEVYEITRA